MQRRLSSEVQCRTTVTAAATLYCDGASMHALRMIYCLHSEQCATLLRTAVNHFLFRRSHARNWRSMHGKGGRPDGRERFPGDLTVDLMDGTSVASSLPSCVSRPFLFFSFAVGVLWNSR
jgi:hypothetical protein